ncbi:hypothetical protein EDB95_2323 [Dinghuibacter silviterrae]|uniref:Uncharacterized protein n=1 Tax=Dinghuibacter silviterrae TaxID=1539049 RepID=A0A4R8DSS4_9BACT|nr:hypothetical protein EDB95_2323 [Dinghuibacter silviterrae]
MSDKNKYYPLDDVRIVGKQDKKSALAQKQDERKTGAIFRAARSKAATPRPKAPAH